MRNPLDVRNTQPPPAKNLQRRWPQCGENRCRRVSERAVLWIVLPGWNSRRPRVSASTWTEKALSSSPRAATGGDHGMDEFLERRVSNATVWSRRLAIFSAVLFLTAGIGASHRISEHADFFPVLGVVAAFADTGAPVCGPCAFPVLALWRQGRRHPAFRDPRVASGADAVRHHRLSRPYTADAERRLDRYGRPAGARRSQLRSGAPA